MSISEVEENKNKQVVRQFYEEIWNKGQLQLIEEIFVKDYKLYTATPGLEAESGTQGLRKNLEVTRRAFGDIYFTIIRQIAEGALVVTQWSATQTHTGEFLGFAPTYKKATTNGVGINRLEGGKIVESWVYSDQCIVAT